jgi:hypothetical protein
MTHQAPPSPSGAADPARKVAQLGELLRLVRQIAGELPRRPDEADLEAAAQVSIAYERSLPIVQRRFDTQAAEVGVWASAGVEALAGEGSEPSRAAALRLARQLDNALASLIRMLD